MTNETHEVDGEAQSLKYVPDITRRRVLQGAAATGAVGMLSGVGSAQEDSSERYIVGLEAQTSYGVATSRAASVYRRLDFGSIGKAVAGQFSEQERDALAKRDDVRYIEPDVEMHAIAQTKPWGVDRVDADKVHDNGKTGAGADIAILDSGIDATHPDLQDNLGTGKAFVQCTGDCTEPWDDDNSHGTHCAGIADAIDNDKGVIGVSTEATLHAVKVLNARGVGSLSDVAAGLEWTADRSYDVASLSLGVEDEKVGGTALKEACQYAYDNGVLVVASAGNDGGEYGGSDVDVDVPASYETVIAVSATDQDDTIAEYSSRGKEVELAAPGTEILSTLPKNIDGDGYGKLSGTSMACPHVAGAGGLLMALGFSNTEARDRLSSTAEDIGLPSEQQGAGLLDVESAVPDPEPEEKTLRVEGTGDYAFYAFTASDNVTITEDDREDEVNDSTAYGAVGSKSDSYKFTGSLENFFISGDAKAFVNDEPIDPSEYPSSLHAITFKGKGGYATYEFKVSETMMTSRGLDGEDTISGNHAKGAVGPGQEIYVYTGDLTNLSTNGDLKVIKSDVVSVTSNNIVTTNEKEIQEDDT